MKKIIALLMILILSLGSITFATQSNSPVLLTGNSANEEYDIYASKSLERHVSNLVEQKLLDNKSYEMSQGIQQFACINGKIIANEIYYYFVYDNNTIIGVLGVYKDSDNSLSSTFSTSYAEKLNSTLKSSKEKYTILADNNSLYLVKNNKILVELENLFKTTRNNDELVDISYDVTETNSIELGTLPMKSIVATQSISSKFLDVRVVPQYNEPICWAGSMASVINYLRGTNYTAHQVAVGTNNGISGANAYQTKNYYINTYRILANLENSMN